MIYPRHIVYSLEALAYLACQEKGTYSKVHSMAVKLNIPRHYLGKILTELVKKGLVSSIKGPAGGFVLNGNVSNFALFDVLQSLGGIEKLQERCVMGFGDCSSETPCVFHDLWSEFKEGAISEIQKLTLEDFSQILRKRIMSGPNLKTETKATA